MEHNVDLRSTFFIVDVRFRNAPAPDSQTNRLQLNSVRRFQFSTSIDLISLGLKHYDLLCPKVTIN